MKPPIKACLKATEAPPRIARIPPVMQPDKMAFKESSFYRYDINMHSQLENIPPHRPKLPPRNGARFLTWQSPLNIRCPLGAFIRPVYQIIRVSISQLDWCKKLK